MYSLRPPKLTHDNTNKMNKNFLKITVEKEHVETLEQRCQHSAIFFWFSTTVNGPSLVLLDWLQLATCAASQYFFKELLFLHFFFKELLCKFGISFLLQMLQQFFTRWCLKCQAYEWSRNISRFEGRGESAK